MNNYIYKILEFSNYDGDSFDLTLDLGFDLISYKKCRIIGVDTPELRGGTTESKAAGYLAKDAAAQFVTISMGAGGAFFVSENYSGKFGRPLGDIINSDGDSLREYLIENKLGVAYHGQAKREIADDHAANLKYLQEQGRI